MFKRFFKYIFFSLFLISCGSQRIKNQINLYAEKPIKNYELNSINDTLYIIEDNFFLKNKVGNWELYVSGSPSELGTKMGMFTQDLYHFQEKALFEKVIDVIPNPRKQKILFSFLQYYNRNLTNHIANEYREEIFNLSKFATDDYDFLANKYKRCLFLHGAHDIGHAFQDLMLVGCSSFAVWNEKTNDGNLLVGRNFDFYVNDDFAKNKVVAFIRPETGYPFMSVTWAGMIGVTSGMNLEGITVTLNAAKSSIPLQSKTPISLVAREILQYAKTIDEAIQIASKREVFVSESLLVTSGNENKAVIIEMTPNKLSVFEQENSSEIICSNHFQSDDLLNDVKNIETIQNSHSDYRWHKMQESIEHQTKLNETDVARILRDKNGINNKEIGLGNEKALNQLNAHHAVIFKPKSKIVWVSSNPYQLGEFSAYDLNEVFDKNRKFENKSLMQENLNIPADEFMFSKEFSNFNAFKKLDSYLEMQIQNNGIVEQDFVDNYIKLNKEYWLVYYRLGVYYFNKKDFTTAEKYFSKALEKEITTKNNENSINSYLNKIRKKLK